MPPIVTAVRFPFNLSLSWTRFRGPTARVVSPTSSGGRNKAVGGFSFALVQRYSRDGILARVFHWAQESGEPRRTAF
jgi:hypothetical protein